MTEPHPVGDLVADPWWVESFQQPVFLLVESRVTGSRPPPNLS
jgi:hypothetical protein